MAERLVLLAVHAHPDDESLGTGGTLARYASEGIGTVLVCATRGEEGELLNPSMKPDEIPDDISQLRMRELDAAIRILGVHRVFFLGYRDSGMEGRASNAHPAALRNADPEEATERLVRIMREVRPHVVMTYNEKGIYGHPDHIAVNRITVSAVKSCADPERYAHLPHAPWRPQKLYYTALPRSRMLMYKRVLEDRGEEVDFDIDMLGTPDEAITTRIDVRPFLDRKLGAISCHRSQIGPRSFVSRVPEPLRSEALGTESYVCVQGCREGTRGEDDLFSGLRNS